MTESFMYRDRLVMDTFRGTPAWVRETYVYGWRIATVIHTFEKPRGSRGRHRVRWNVPRQARLGAAALEFGITGVNHARSSHGKETS